MGALQVLSWDVTALIRHTEPISGVRAISSTFMEPAQYQASFRPMLLLEIQAQIVRAIESDSAPLVCELVSVGAVSDLHTVELKLDSHQSIPENVSLVTLSPTPTANPNLTPTPENASVSASVVHWEHPPVTVMSGSGASLQDSTQQDPGGGASYRHAPSYSRASRSSAPPPQTQ